MNFNDKDEAFKNIYTALQSKLVHIQYTTTKALKLQSKMLSVAKNKKISVDELTNLINQLYKYRKKLEKRIQQAGTSKSADEKKLLSLVSMLNAQVEEIRQSTIISSKLMKTSADSLLMIILKAQHYQWRELMYMSALSQNNNSIPQQDEFSCALGKWYNGEGKDNFSHLPAFSLLGDYHSKFHRISADILKEGFNGISWEKISRNLEEFEKYSNLVISALDKLDEQILMIDQINCDY
ncbi:CZB domain-containing protein [Hafnia paralvei]|uniref:CZB domain-containing protein n=1 Tax=Hafnia paralvei TaxID=546367 RepID=UPI00141A270E|nr:CZB domain-containing protein [Hafnia paralvei]NIH31749.1 hypothetical protein [Hafnia paralvei]